MAAFVVVKDFRYHHAVDKKANKVAHTISFISDPSQKHLFTSVSCTSVQIILFLLLTLAV